MTSGEQRPALALRLVAWYEAVIRFLAGTSMIAIIVVMIVQVIARYVFNASIIWAEELCRYVLIWQTFLFIGLAYKKGELVAVDMIPLMLAPRWRFALHVVVSIPIMVFLWLLVTNGYDYASRFDNQVIPAIDFIWMSIADHGVGVSIWWVYISVSVGSAVLALHILGALVENGLAVFAGAQAEPTPPPQAPGR